MAISITERPSKTLSNGFLSKWSSSELPLQYKLTSDLFPLNSTTPLTITNLFYAANKKGVQVTFTGVTNFLNKYSVSINGTNTNLDGGVYSIKELISSNVIIIDVFTQETSSTGTAQRFYPNYKGLIKVFAGAPDQHPYNDNGSKPLEEIGIIEVDFKDINQNNVGIADVRGYIKAAINAKFDDDENTHFGWSSYSIEYAESYDDVANNTIFNFISSFEPDIQADCGPFNNFDNNSFSNGLTDWSQESTPFGGSSSWNAGTGNVFIDNALGFGTNVLYQDVKVYSGVTYSYSVDYEYEIFQGYSINVLICGKKNGNWFPFGSIQRQNQTGSEVLDFEVTFPDDYEATGIVFRGNSSLGADFDVKLNSFDISTTAVQPCLFVQWANFGTKQFQDNLGGNFGDYVLNSVDTITPKILTHFESKTYFKGKPFYFTSIIPESTFSLSEGADNLYLDFVLDNGFNEKVKVNNTGEGVYTIDLQPYLIDAGVWTNGQARFTITPTNTLLDGDRGTYNNEDPLTWNITALVNSPSNPDYVGSPITASQQTARMGSSAPSMQSGQTLLIDKFDTAIPTIIGETYVIESEVSASNSNFAPSMRGNSECFFIVEGYDLEDLNISTFECPPDPVSPFTVDGKITTSFVATSTTINIIFAQRVFNTITTATGGVWGVDNTTFKGPIDYISEIKPITNSKECDRYGGTLRWLNDLNGWETWNFTKKKIEKEKVTKKIDIVKDYNNDWDNSFIDSETQRDTIQTTANKSILLRSQILNSNQKTVLEQIKRSARVQYLTYDNKWQTVTIKTSSYEIINEEEKIHEMDIEINLPDLIIQAQ